jgi:hypothetical protein
MKKETPVRLYFQESPIGEDGVFVSFHFLNVSSKLQQANFKKHMYNAGEEFFNNCNKYLAEIKKESTSQKNEEPQ